MLGSEGVLRSFSCIYLSWEYFHSFKLKYSISMWVLKRHSLWPKAPLRTFHFWNLKLSHSSQSYWEMCGNYFYTSWLIGETWENFRDNIRKSRGKGGGRNLPSQRGNEKFWWRDRLIYQMVKICLGVILAI